MQQIRAGGRAPAFAERDAGGLLALLLAIVTGQQSARSATAILHAQLDTVFAPEG